MKAKAKSNPIPMVEVSLTEREATLLYLVLGEIKFTDAVEWANARLSNENTHPAWKLTTRSEIEQLFSDRDCLIKMFESRGTKKSVIHPGNSPKAEKIDDFPHAMG